MKHILLTAISVALLTPGCRAADKLAEQYREWMQERWNHPCVVIWDACNETDLPETEEAYTQVRALDLSHRPWDIQIPTCD